VELRARIGIRGNLLEWSGNLEILFPGHSGLFLATRHRRRRRNLCFALSLIACRCLFFTNTHSERLSLSASRALLQHHHAPSRPAGPVSWLTIPASAQRPVPAPTRQPFSLSATRAARKPRSAPIHATAYRPPSWPLCTRAASHYRSRALDTLPGSWGQSKPVGQIRAHSAGSVRQKKEQDMPHRHLDLSLVHTYPVAGHNTTGPATPHQAHRHLDRESSSAPRAVSFACAHSPLESPEPRLRAFNQPGTSCSAGAGGPGCSMRSQRSAKHYFCVQELQQEEDRRPHNACF
jgi:hypothetical protein